MPEKFHYQTPEGEKPFDKEQVEDLFLMLNLEKARKLAKDYSLEKPAENIHSAIDISNILKDEMSWEEIMPIIQSGKFEGVNVGTDQIKTVEQAQQIKTKLEEHQTKVISFHGSVDPYFIGMSKQLKGELVKHDFEIADIFDTDQSSPINYDLVAAELSDINEFQRGKTLTEIHRIQREKLAAKGIGSEKDIIEAIIKYVGKNRPVDSKRPITFEMYQSFVAETATVSEENMKHFVECARKYIGKDEIWGITIDVGHLFNHLIMNLRIEGAKAVKSKINEIFNVLEKYKEHIRMVHASGTVSANLFQASRALSSRANIDYEAIRAWSLHQVIDNGLLCEMIKRMRKIKQGEYLIENSEIRPIHSAAKYFGDTLHFDKDKSSAIHKEQLKLQAEILGYNKN